MIDARRYDIDWLRVIAIGLLLIYHIAIVFQPWGVWIQFMQNKESLEGLWIPMAMLNVWRIPLLFFVSGMGVAFAMRKRSWKELMWERTKRILVPFLFGMFVIVPLHILLWQKFYGRELEYPVSPGHLWFLANIFVYVLVLSPFFFLLKNNAESAVSKFIKKLFGNPLSFILVAMLFVMETVILKPNTYEMYAMTPHGFWLGFLSFLFGFCFILSGEGFVNLTLKWKWVLLLLAVVSYFVRLFVFELKAPAFVSAIETCLWIFSLLGFAYRYLNRPSIVLTYLSQAAYPVYILHMLFLYFATFFVLPLGISASVKFGIVVVFTGIGCMLSYEFVVKRITWVRPLFGLKREK